MIPPTPHLYYAPIAHLVNLSAVDVDVVPPGCPVATHLALEGLGPGVDSEVLVQPLAGGEPLPAGGAAELSKLGVLRGQVRLQPRRLLVGVAAQLANPGLILARRVVHLCKRNI